MKEDFKIKDFAFKSALSVDELMNDALANAGQAEADGDTGARDKNLEQAVTDENEVTRLIGVAGAAEILNI